MSTADVMAQLNKPTTPTGPRTDGVEGVDYEVKRNGRGSYRKYYSDDEKRAMNYKPPTMEWRNNPLMEHSNAQARLAYGLEHSDLDNPNYAKPTTDVSSFSVMDSVAKPEPPKLAPVNTLLGAMPYNAFNSTEEPKKPSPRAQQIGRAHV